MHLSPTGAEGWRRWWSGSYRVALGDERLVGYPTYTVPLFQGGGTLPPDTSKSACLERFFRLVLKRLTDQHLFRTKPRVEIRGAASLERALAGYQQESLQSTLAMAGAGTVEFRD